MSVSRLRNLDLPRAFSLWARAVGLAREVEGGDEPAIKEARDRYDAAVIAYAAHHGRYESTTNLLHEDQIMAGMDYLIDASAARAAGHPIVTH